MILSGKVKRARKKIKEEKAILSIYFHNPSRMLFSTCIKWLQKKGYHFISLEQLERILTGKTPLQENAVVISIDDGWKENSFNVVEFANDHKIPVAIFVTTSTVENGGGFWWSYAKKGKKMGLLKETLNTLKSFDNDERVRVLSVLRSMVYLEREAFTKAELIKISQSENITVGGHTETHPILPNCSDVHAFAEINGSKQKLEGWLKKEVSYFSYPNGDFTERDMGMVAQSGYRMGFTTNPKYLRADHELNVYSLPRFEVLEDATFTENICRMTGAWFT